MLRDVLRAPERIDFFATLTIPPTLPSTIAPFSLFAYGIAATVFSLVDALADGAMPLRRRSLGASCWLEFVPSSAARPSMVRCAVSYASQHVRADGNEFEVLRIDTSANAAEMVDLQTSRDRTSQQLPCNSVCQQVAGPLVEHAVSSRRRHVARPKPAPSVWLRLDAIPEQHIKWLGYSSHEHSLA